MRLLFLGPEDSLLVPYLSEDGPVVATDSPLTVEFINAAAPDWTISYGYRHILRGDALARVMGRAINLHIAMLPWNRGADPNLWSFVEGTPKGVSIHFIDSGIDTGDVIAQREVAIPADATLASSYAVLRDEMQCLFRECWPAIRDGVAPRRRQPRGGSYHRTVDAEDAKHRLAQGWDTPVASLRRGQR
jgi:methionyl-tRNA formyltransferase